MGSAVLACNGFGRGDSTRDLGLLEIVRLGQHELIGDGGGEFVLVEQRPRQQSRAEVVRLARGEAVIFATRHRPAAGSRGDFRVTLRHGVSRVTSGSRFTLGVIFHDAE